MAVLTFCESRAPDRCRQQIEILNGQNRVLAILDNFASKDMPGRQHEMQDAVHKILAIVSHEPTAG